MKLTARRILATAVAAVMVLAGVVAGTAVANAASTPPAIVPGAPANPYGMIEYNGLLYFAAVAEGDIYTTLFSFDGTTFTNVPGSPEGIGEMTVYNGNLIISAPDDLNDLPYAFVMFSYDGTGFTQVAGAFESPNDYVEVAGTLYFQADVASVWGIWQYDGTTTSPVPGTADTSPAFLSTAGGILYFTGDTDPSPAEAETLFSYDPSAPLVPAAAIPGAPAGPGTVVSYEGAAWFGASGSLYSFDGASTFTPHAIAPSQFADAITAFDGALYFTGYDGTDYAPYSYAGGVTTRVPGGVLTETSDYYEYRGVLYFFGFVDGTPTLSGISAGVASAVAGSPEYPFDLVEFQGKLYFSGDVADADYAALFVYETTDDPQLASTGVDFRMPGLIALVLLLAGAAALAARPRRA